MFLTPGTQLLEEGSMTHHHKVPTATTRLYDRRPIVFAECLMNFLSVYSYNNGENTGNTKIDLSI